MLTDTAFSPEELALLAMEPPLATPVSKQTRRRHDTCGNAVDAAQATGGKEPPEEKGCIRGSEGRGGFHFPFGAWGWSG